MTVINCRFCDGPREVLAGICTGCGSFEQNADKKTRKRKHRIRAPKCPKCESRRHSVNTDDDFVCSDCGTTYANVDVSYEHGDPVINASKKGL